MPSYNFTVFNDYGRHDYVGTDMSVEQGLLTIADDGVSVVHFAPGTWRHVERSFQKEDSPYEALKQQAKDMTDEERRAFIKPAKRNLDKLYDRAREAANENLPPAYGQWQPIETAPPACSYVLAHGPNLGSRIGGPTIEIGYYDGDYWTNGGTHLPHPNSNPTHWMPLPEQPEEQPKDTP